MLIPETKTLDVFLSELKPLEGYGMMRFDEKANRFGSIVMDSILYYWIHFGLSDLRIDIAARSEFDHFETFDDLFQYFKELILENREDLRERFYG